MHNHMYKRTDLNLNQQVESKQVVFQPVESKQQIVLKQQVAQKQLETKQQVATKQQIEIKQQVATKQQVVSKTERYIYQHHKEKPGTFQQVLVVTTCPYDNTRYITSHFERGKQLRHDYQNPIFWLTKDQVDQLVAAAQKNGYKLISNEYAAKYGI